MLWDTLCAELQHLLPQVRERTNSTLREISALPFRFVRVTLLPATGMTDFCMNNKMLFCEIYLKILQGTVLTLSLSRLGLSENRSLNQKVTSEVTVTNRSSGVLLYDALGRGIVLNQFIHF